MTTILTILLCGFVASVLFSLALCKAAARSPLSDEPNPFRDLKGEPKPISETRGGNDAAPQLLSMNPKILRGFKTSLAVLLVASLVLVGCEKEKPADSIQAEIHYMEGAVAALKVAKEIQGGLLTPSEAGIKLGEARTNYLRSLSAKLQ